MLKFVQRICVLSLKFVKFLLTANIEQYFLYNGILYLVLGAITWFTVDSVRAFLCNIPGQAALGGIGCENCPDNLLLCSKSACWRQAMNLTIQKDSMEPNDPFFQYRTEAALDSSCNTIMANQQSSIGMLTGVLDLTASSGGTAPTKACRRFHCKVLLNSVLGSQNTELPGLETDKCTNDYGLKLGTPPTQCTCYPEVVALRLETAAQFADLCGAMASDLTGLIMFTQNLRKSKDACYADNIIDYYTKMSIDDPQQAINIFNLRNCTYLTQQAFTVVEWFSLKVYETDLYMGGKTAYRFNAPSTCILDYCNVFNATLYSPKCVWSQSQQLLSVTQADLTIVEQHCPGMGFTLDNVCRIVGPGPAACAGYYAPTPSPAVTVTTTTTGAGGASSRRLDAPAPTPPPSIGVVVGSARGAPGPCGAGQDDGSCSPSSAEMMRALHGGLAGGFDLEHQPPVWVHPRADSRPRWPGRRPSDGTVGLARAIAQLDAVDVGVTVADMGKSAAEVRSRQLQAAPAPAPNANNADLEDWVVTPYSKCSCPQQCVEGVRFRSVTCPSGMTCKEPKPATSQPCVCGPCTDCQVDMILKGMAATYWFQGTSCLMLCMAFYSVSALTEDDMSDMRIGTKILGCFCKAWPVLVRIGVYVVLMFVLFFAFAVLPGTGFMNDCHSSDSLVLLTICTGACFALQFIAGIVFKRKTKMPPWLHNSVKDGWANLLMMPLRAIGP